MSFSGSWFLSFNFFLCLLSLCHFSAAKDLSFLGCPIRGHVFAVRSGHYLNAQLVKQIFEENVLEKFADKVSVDESNGKVVSIEKIMEVLPHRRPFSPVDIVIEIEDGKRAVGIKNLTFNELFFQGHFS